MENLLIVAERIRELADTTAGAIAYVEETDNIKNATVVLADVMDALEQMEISLRLLYREYPEHVLHFFHEESKPLLMEMVQAVEQADDVGLKVIVAERFQPLYTRWHKELGVYLSNNFAG